MNNQEFTKLCISLHMHACVCLFVVLVRQAIGGLKGL